MFIVTLTNWAGGEHRYRRIEVTFTPADWYRHRRFTSIQNYFLFMLQNAELASVTIAVKVGNLYYTVYSNTGKGIEAEISWIDE